jgi:hypothetical protein
MFEGTTIDELIECVIRAEHRARQHPNAFLIDKNSENDQDTNHFLLGAA